MITRNVIYVSYVSMTSPESPVLLDGVVTKIGASNMSAMANIVVIMRFKTWRSGWNGPIGH